jgi:hypothetical protein
VASGDTTTLAVTQEAPMHPLKPALMTALTAALWGFAPAAALANCAQPVGYSARLSGTDVEICPVAFDDRGCANGDRMLRQDEATGAAVALPQRCLRDGPCYLDACPPAGVYRYGFAEPFECHPSSCGTSFFTGIEVDTDQAACGAPDGLTPEPAAGTPWRRSASICEYGGGSEDGGCSQGGGDPTATILGLNLAALLLGVGLIRRRRREGEASE